MPKRKREDRDEVQSARQQRVRYKLKVGITKLGHAFKVSKGFERQKLGRRRKSATAQSQEKDVHRIDLEIAALKALDTATSAQQHLFKSLLKIKAVADHPDLPREVKKPITASSDAAALNVNARLCKANQVQDALSTALADIQQSLGLDAQQTKSSKKRRVRAKDVAAQNVMTMRDSDEREDLRAASSGDDDAESHDGDEGSGDEDMDEMNRFLAPGSSEEENSDSAERAELSKARHGKSPVSKSEGYSLEADLSISGSEMESRSSSPEPQRAAVSSKKPSYLPSLTMAGYVSGSESDVAEDIDLAPRKNRRGQRARQQIWEQKYGSKAKHLQRKDGNVRWDSKRGAVDGTARRGDRGGSRHGLDHALGGGGKVPKSQSAGPDEPAKRKKQIDPNAPVHPSWEAAKKAKEKREAPVVFQGKKITF